MQKYRFKIFLFVLVAATVYAACRKTDQQQSGEPIKKDVVAKFFSNNTSTVPLVIALSNFMKAENNKYGNVEKIIKQIGYPIWNKALIGSKKSGGVIGLESDNDSLNIVYIPFVRDSENFVNGSLIFKTSPNDTSYQFLLDWQYANYSFDTTAPGWNARNVFHLFANFDKEVFGRTAFKITDSRLFGEPASGNMLVVKLKLPDPGVQYHLDVLTPFEFCDIYDVCWGPDDEEWCSGGCNELCEYYTHSETECTTIWIETGGGTGGSGGGGGATPPQCPGGPTTPGTVFTDIDFICGPGWVPVPIGLDDPPEPLNDSTIAENLKRLVIKGQAQRNIDSLHSKAQEDGLERTFTFNLNGSDTSAVYPLKGGTHTSQPNLFSNSIAIFHTHNEDDPIGGTDKNQCFDGPDIYKLYKNATVDLYPLAVSLISTRDYIYAFVIIDKNKYKNYTDSICGNPKDIKVLAKNLNNLHVDAWDNCIGCTWQKASEAGTLSVTANNNLSISGVRVFKSPRQNINFTLLTP